MEKEIVYVADLDQDIDDVVAAHYLNNKGVLKCVVYDPFSNMNWISSQERILCVHTISMKNIKCLLAGTRRGNIITT